MSRDYVEEGFRLGDWATHQRSLYAKEELDDDRVTRLEELNGWTWDGRAERWEEGFNHLCRFVESEGHCRPRRLGTWRMASGSASGYLSRNGLIGPGSSLPTAFPDSRPFPDGAGTGERNGETSQAAVPCCSFWSPRIVPPSVRPCVRPLVWRRTERTGGGKGHRAGPTDRQVCSERGHLGLREVEEDISVWLTTLT